MDEIFSDGTKVSKVYFCLVMHWQPDRCFGEMLSNSLAKYEIKFSHSLCVCMCVHQRLRLASIYV